MSATRSARSRAELPRVPNDILPANTNSWAPIWDGSQAGKLSIFNGQAFIADAAVYLKATQPDLNITNPYELDETSSTRPSTCSRSRRPTSASTGTASTYADQVTTFKSGETTVGTTWPYQVGLMAAEKPPLTVTARQAEGGHDGLVGHVDDLHEGRASELHVPLDELHHLAGGEREGRRVLRRGAVEREGVRLHDEQEPCDDYHATDEAWWKDVYYWDTPKADCGDDRGEVCKTYEDWQAAWTEIKG